MMSNSSVGEQNPSQLPWQQVRYKQREPDGGQQAAELQTLLARDGALRQQYEDLLQRHSAQAEEFEHRLLNSIQMIASLLSAQSRRASPEAAAQLMIAVNRIVAFGHVHRQLHLLDHQKNVEFKPYLERLCENLSSLFFRESAGDTIVVQGTSCDIPTALGIPLGFIVSELVTNSAKYAKGSIIIRFETPSPHSHSLLIADDGPGLPPGFELDDAKGLGMKIVQGLVKQIDGELRILRDDNGRGARFLITFRSPAPESKPPVRDKGATS